MWLSFAPQHPESLTQAIAKRASVTPVSSAVLPPRECPTTATCRASSVGSVSIQSITRDAPQAQAERMPQLSGVRSSTFWKTPKTPFVKSQAPSRARSPLKNARAA